ncbi:MAG: septal ring lytic transglycosylase RlpA family protein [Alloprevotella sp.]
MTFKTIFITLFTALVSLNFVPASAQTQTGIASYYGNQFHGRRTSSGEIYHRDSLTCAHRTLPFGTLLKVRNTKNGREVVVKVTDRGPFRRGGIVDLSMAAAKEIGMVSSGIVRVEVEQVKSPKNSGGKTAESKFELPPMRFYDATTGEFHTMSEWLKLSEGGQNGKTVVTKRDKASFVTKAKAMQNKWRLHTEKVAVNNK